MCRGGRACPRRPGAVHTRCWAQWSAPPVCLGGAPSRGESFRTGAPVNFPADVPWDMSFELISSGGTGGIAPGGDLNGDGVVDVQDVSILMGLWLD